MQPTQLGPYTIGTRLGRGGMGAVFEATDAAGHRVAVKLLASHLADDVGLRRRFDAEIATLKTLRHPGIVQLLAFGEEDDQPYFAMELVPGQSLEQLLRAGRRFTWRETVSVALGVCRALKAAHDQGVVHRDLKPANLLVADGDGASLGDRVKLADFGIAKLFGGAAHTAHGNIVGTAEYMAPEQATGGPVDHRVDIYALGLVMFAMLTGKPPFTGTQAAEILRRQQHDPPPRVSAVVAAVPPELDQLIDRMLAKSPAARPANALALGRLLTAIETLHVPAPVAETGPLTPLPPSRDLPEPGSAEPVDLYAPTQAVPAAGATAAAPPPPGQTAAATGALAGNTTKPVEVAGVAGTGFDPAAETVVDRAPRKRFTTVEDLDRVATAREARARTIEQRWQAAVALVTLVALVGGGYFLLRKPSAEQLFGRIDAARRAAAQGGDLRDAGPAIEEFLRRFPDDPR
ncbi:MAG: serine/threonine protein kinase, partial [Planctomycetia bacterium]|nr:serine/threonine protein kinase [Planctomycetia bacterium]